MKNKIHKDFSKNLDKMNYLFPVGYNFLSGIIHNEFDGFWLSTAQNAHLYYKNGYYMYILLSIGSLEIRSDYNQRIEPSTSNKSNLIFLEPIKKVIESLNGFSEGWASIEGMGSIKLTNKTPEEFFIECLNLIEKVHR